MWSHRPATVAPSQPQRKCGSVTGAKEKRLEKKVSAIKKRVKGKLHMLYAIEARDGGDMTFLRQIAANEKREMAKIN